MFTSHQQELNFVAFREAYVAPAVRLSERARDLKMSREARSFAQAAQFESLCWMALGTLLQYLRREDAASLADSMVRISPPYAEGFLELWGHLFDGNWLAYLDSDFDPDRIRFAFPGGRTEREMELGIEIFGACLSNFLYLSRTESANAAVAVLNFGGRSVLNRYLTESVGLGDVSDALAFDRGFDPESGEIRAGSLYAGLGRMIDFLENFRETRQLYWHEYPEELELSNSLFRGIAQLLRWRFFFIEDRTRILDPLRDRYMDVLQIGDAEPRKQFVNYVKILANNWGDLQHSQKSMAAV